MRERESESKQTIHRTSELTEAQAKIKIKHEEKINNTKEFFGNEINCIFK